MHPGRGTGGASKTWEVDGVVRILFANLAAFASAGLGVLSGLDGTVKVLFLLGSLVAAIIEVVVLSGLEATPSSTHVDISEGGNFVAPFFPWVQGGALWVNWFLVCQLPGSGLVALGSYIAFAVVHYICYGARYSVGNWSGWSAVSLSSSVDGLLTTSHSRSHSFHLATIMNLEGLPGVTVEGGVEAPLLDGSAGVGTGANSPSPGGGYGRYGIDHTPAADIVSSDRRPSASGMGSAGAGSHILRRRPTDGAH